MKKVLLEKFEKMIEKQEDYQSFSWANVFYLLLHQAGIEDLKFEDIVMVSGEGFAFAYSPYHYAPMYLGLFGSGERIRDFYGYSTIWLKGPTRGGDLDQAWEFITKHLDEGKGIHIEGPESFLIYGYQDSGKKEDRMLKCIAQWGPGLNGDVTWEEFSKYPAIFSLSVLTKTNPPLSPIDNTRKIVNQMLKYQTRHPGIGQKFKVSGEVKIPEMKGKEIKLTAENFGLLGFEALIKDVQNKEMVQGMLQAYLYCHAINFHLWGRQWQSKWFKNKANDYKGKKAQLFLKIANEYQKVAENLEKFVEHNSKNFETGTLHAKILNAVPDLKKAFEHENTAVALLADLVQEIGPKEPETLEGIVKEALYSGMGAGDTHINPFSALEGINEEILHKKPADNIMSIWEQLTHLHFWNELGLQNIKEGKPHWADVDWNNYPPNYLKKYGDWQGFHKAILDAIIEIQQITKDTDEINKRFSEIDNISFIQMVRFLCSHMSYHIAQVVMTRKLLDNWPPLGNYTSYHLIG